MSKSDKYTPDNYDAFISYKHQTGFYMAQVIYDKLVQNGYSVYVAVGGSAGAQPYDGGELYEPLSCRTNR